MFVMFINRDYSRTEHDDFELKIQPKLNEFNEVLPIYYEDQIIGWRIQLRFS